MNNHSNHQRATRSSLCNPAPFSRPWWIAALAITLVLATIIKDASGSSPIQLDGIYRLPRSRTTLASQSMSQPILAANDAVQGFVHHAYVDQGFSDQGIHHSPIRFPGDAISQATFQRWRIKRAIRNREVVESLVPVFD